MSTPDPSTAIIEAAANKFLGWQLPSDFSPDAGISFKPAAAHGSHGWPVGTNVLTFEQARAMFVHCIGTAISELDRSETQLIAERDRAVEMADKLAEKIAQLEGLEIGEHSNGNCPWTNALNGESEDAD